MCRKCVGCWAKRRRERRDCSKTGPNSCDVVARDAVSGLGRDAFQRVSVALRTVQLGTAGRLSVQKRGFASHPVPPCRVAPGSRKPSKKLIQLSADAQPPDGGRRRSCGCKSRWRGEREDGATRLFVVLGDVTGAIELTMQHPLAPHRHGGPKPFYTAAAASRDAAQTRRSPAIIRAEPAVDDAFAPSLTASQGQAAA